MLYIIDAKPKDHDSDRPLEYEKVMFAVLDITPELAQQWLGKIRQAETIAQQCPKMQTITLEDTQKRLELYRPDEELEELFYDGSECVDTHPVTEEELSIIEDKLPYEVEHAMYVESVSMIVTPRSIRWEINGDTITTPLFDIELEKMLGGSK